MDKKVEMLLEVLSENPEIQSRAALYHVAGCCEILTHFVLANSLCRQALTEAG